MNKNKFNHSFNMEATNICKGLGILLMYFHHSFYKKTGFADVSVIFTPFTQHQTIVLAQIAKICVSVFVFLTAYGNYRSTVRKGSIDPDYFKKKYIPKTTQRLYNLMLTFLVVYLISIICSPIIGISFMKIYGGSKVKAIFYMIVDALGLAHLLSTPTYNPTWWYMTLAYTLIIILPFLVLLTERIGYLMIPAVLLIPDMCGFNMSDGIFRYILVIALGLVFAKYDLMEKLDEWMSKNAFAYIFGIVVCLIIAAASCILRVKLNDYLYIFDGILGTIVCILGYVMMRRIPVMNRCLMIIGRYSMYMFMIHTLIRKSGARFHAFSYSPKYPVLIVLLLVIDTLIISIGIDFIKVQVFKLTDRIFYKK